jgi:hypothetical protein
MEKVEKLEISSDAQIRLKFQISNFNKYLATQKFPASPALQFSITSHHDHPQWYQLCFNPC